MAARPPDDGTENNIVTNIRRTSIGVAALFLGAACMSTFSSTGASAWTDPVAKVAVGGGIGQDEANSVTQDSAGNIFTAGVFAKTTDFDPGPGTAAMTAAGGRDAFVQKLDANGNFLWAQRFGCSGWFNDGYSVALDSSGNVYVVGDFGGTCDFDPTAGVTTLSSTSLSTFIVKLDTNGAFVWAETLAGTGLNAGSSVQVDASTNLIVAGLFSGTVDFDPGVGVASVTAAGGFDGFVTKLSSSGTLIWARTFGGASDELARSVGVDTANGITVSGWFSGIADLDPGVAIAPFTSAGGTDAFVVKLDANGTFAWADQFGGSSDDRALGLTVDSSANVYVTGGFLGAADFDPGAGTTLLTSAGNSDVFLAKLTPAGALLAVRQFGSSGDDAGITVGVGSSGDVSVGGSFSGTVDLGLVPGSATLTSAGNDDGFVVTLDPAFNTRWADGFGGPSYDSVSSVSVSGGGPTLVAGYFAATADLDPSTGVVSATSNGSDDSFLVALDSLGFTAPTTTTTTTTTATPTTTTTPPVIVPPAIVAPAALPPASSQPSPAGPTPAAPTTTPASSPTSAPTTAKPTAPATSTPAPTPASTPTSTSTPAARAAGVLGAVAEAGPAIAVSGEPSFTG